METINKIILFFKEAYYELKQVSWLGRKELLAQTSIVVILILIVAFYVGLIDFILSKLLSFIL